MLYFDCRKVIYDTEYIFLYCSAYLAFFTFFSLKWPVHGLLVVPCSPERIQIIAGGIACIYFSTMLFFLFYWSESWCKGKLKRHIMKEKVILPPLG